MIEGGPRKLPWDSQFFGHAVAAAAYATLSPALRDGLLEWCDKERVDVLYLLTGVSDQRTVRVAVEGGFELVDIRLELTATVGTAPLQPVQNPHRLILRTARQDDLEELVSIAVEAHTDSRFFVDPKFGTDAASALFATWIRNSVAGELADLVMVAELDDSVCGYITGSVGPDGDGVVGLFGVSESARGQGVGGSLIQALLKQWKGIGIRSARVVTQGRNIAAQRIYQRSGFRSSTAQFWFHYWMS